MRLTSILRYSVQFPAPLYFSCVSQKVMQKGDYLFILHEKSWLLVELSLILGAFYYSICE